MAGRLADEYCIRTRGGRAAWFARVPRGLVKGVRRIAVLSELEQGLPLEQQQFVPLRLLALRGLTAGPRKRGSDQA
jgi:hypothetical protein